MPTFLPSARPISRRHPSSHRRGPAAARRTGWSFVVALATAAALPAGAATIAVTRGDSAVDPADGACSLAEAITAANTDTSPGAAAGECPAGDAGGRDRIELFGDVRLSAALPVVTSTLEIAGHGHRVERVSGTFRILETAAGSDVWIDASTLANGIAPSSGANADQGGGILGHGDLKLSHSALTGNAAVEGGGLYQSGGVLTIERSTIADNVGGPTSGGVWSRADATAIEDSHVTRNEGHGVFAETDLFTLRSSTVSDNAADGLHVVAPQSILANCSVSGNGANGAWIRGAAPPAMDALVSHCTLVDNGLLALDIVDLDGDGSTRVEDSVMVGSCRVGDEASASDVVRSYASVGPSGSCPGAAPLSPVDGADLDFDLRDHGGATPTHALPPDSVAIDSTPDCALAADQRGVARPVDGDGAAGAACDAGAYEFEPPVPISVGFSARTITPVGPPPKGWGFVPQPETGVWGEEFVDLDGDGCYTIAGADGSIDPETGEITGPTIDFAEPHVDDVRNTQIDPLSAGKWDGIWTNAGFGGKCPEGALDDIWARAIVLSQGSTRVAMVSVDVVGFFQEEIDRVRSELGNAHPEIQLDGLIVSATHAHEGPDTMGLWHGQIGLDGKYPAFQKYIRTRIVQAIAEAYHSREVGYVRFARGTELAGLRDSRPPIVYDPDVWTAQFVRPADGTTIGTLVNWSNHPEALGGSNRMISSDYAHGVRTRMETEYDGTSIFFSGSVGGLMTPLLRGHPTENPIPGFAAGDRSYARAIRLGEIVAEAAIAALDGAPLAASTELSVAHKDFIIPFENQSLTALNEAGVFDKELVIDPATGDSGVLTEMYAVTLGPAVFVTVPGELFPEIANGGYGRDHVPEQLGDCPEAHTGRPFEPVIREQFSATFEFLLGLGQDELGYIVPRYDFWAFGFPPSDEIFEDAPFPPPPLPNPDPRPPVVIGVVERIDPCGEDHYEETVSAASTMAPLVACTAAELAGHDPWGTWDTDPEYRACSPENTSTQPGGIVLPQP